MILNDFFVLIIKGESRTNASPNGTAGTLRLVS
jgi:hypothetical protein